MKKILYPIIILLFVVFMGYNFKDYIPEIPSRFAKYHNIGKITATLDGKALDLSKTALNFKSEPIKVDEVLLTDNGEFRFEEGIYGPNLFSLKLHNETLGELQIEFGQFNTNWWHICDYDVQISMASQPDGEIYAELTQTLCINKDKRTLRKSKTLTLNDNKISIF